MRNRVLRKTKVICMILVALMVFTTAFWNLDFTVFAEEPEDIAETEIVTAETEIVEDVDVDTVEEPEAVEEAAEDEEDAEEATEEETEAVEEAADEETVETAEDVTEEDAEAVEEEAEDAAEVAEAAKNGKTQKPKGPIYRQIEYTTEEEGKKILDAIKDNEFHVIDITKKKGTEAPPRLYDLTSLQVDCNKKFGYSADQTLQLIQALYEKKFTTYPRVDTTFLSDDIYPKCPQTMNGLYKTQFSGVAPYAELVKAIGGKPLKKSKKVFDSSKVTDHHAIIPTGIPPQGLSDMERKVFDLVARAFIAAFYPDLKFETTTIYGRTPLEPSVEELDDTIVFCSEHP